MLLKSFQILSSLTAQSLRDGVHYAPQFFQVSSKTCLLWVDPTFSTSYIIFHHIGSYLANVVTHLVNE